MERGWPLSPWGMGLEGSRATLWGLAASWHCPCSWRQGPGQALHGALHGQLALAPLSLVCAPLCGGVFLRGGAQSWVVVPGHGEEQDLDIPGHLREVTWGWPWP